MAASFRLHLGCGRTILPGWVNLDLQPGPGVEVVADLNACATTALPFADDSCEEILASHVIEHVPNVLPLMQELHRIAKPGALATVHVPYGSSDDAWEDPTHVRPYFLDSFYYFGQPHHWRADYRYTGDWQPTSIILTMDKTRWAGQPVEALVEAVRERRNVVQQMTVTLTAIKPVRPRLKELQQECRVGIHLA